MKHAHDDPRGCGVGALGDQAHHRRLGNAAADCGNCERDHHVSKFAQPIAFNLLPQIDEMMANGYSREEMKMLWETQKIFEDPDILVNATAVRVPVFYGHAEAVHFETRKNISMEEVRQLLMDAPGVEVIEGKDMIHPTPVTHAAGKDPVYVGRLRRDLSHPRGIDMWVVADNIRKGAALNAVQIMDALEKNKLFAGNMDQANVNSAQA